MKNFQTKMDVVGNNISNVNTYGFKKGRTTFKDMVSQSVAGASAPTNTRGGTNPKQVGLGSQIAAIDTLHTTGSLQTTGRTLDLAISGDGFFQVGQSASGTSAFDSIQYTRAGNFYMDSNGMLVNSDGFYLVGFADNTTTPNDSTSYADPDTITGTPNFPATGNPTLTDAAYKPIKIPNDATSVSIGQDGTVTFTDANGELRWAGQLIIAKFSNPEGMSKSGSNYFSETPASGTPALNVAGSGGNGDVIAGSLEMSNVDLSEEFTEMIVAQRGFQANTRIITTSDEILQELMSMKR